MEIEEYVDNNAVQRWGLESLRTVRYEPTVTTIFARSQSMLQRVYSFQTETQPELGIRRTTGLPFKSPLGNLIWLSAYTESSSQIRIGLDSAYVFERTGCLVTPRIVSWGGREVVPILDILIATLNELESMLNLQISGYLAEEDIPVISPSDYLSVDHKKQCKAIVLANQVTLNALEDQVRHYCVNYWNDYEKMGKKVHFELGVFLNPSKKQWTSHELASFELGDLVSIQNYATGASSKQIRGCLRLRRFQQKDSKYEVFIQMTEDDTKLHFGGDSFEEPAIAEQDHTIPPHEQIELEIYAGKTKILFNDLCSVQAGTLIELREHALPIVTLCVMGSPILEGELVHFQDQLMVQITKRLD